MTAKRFPQPSSVDGIKRLAKRLKAQDNIPHMKALDAAARHAGFSNFIDAKRRIARATSAAGLASPPQRPKGNPMPLEDFHRERRDAWDRAIASVAGLNSPPTIVWKGRADIAAALEPFMGANNNHAHLPTGGGMDFEAVRRSAEPGCLEFLAGGRTGYIVKPRKLTLERIDSPGNSFLLLELDELAPTDTYDDGDDAEREEVEKRDRGSEELLELAPGEYEDRGLWDRGFLGYDEGGREIPMPDEARIVVRWLGGKILFVAKGSLWNGSPRTYDGEHDKFSANQIRHAIERALAEEDA